MGLLWFGSSWFGRWLFPQKSRLRRRWVKVEALGLLKQLYAGSLADTAIREQQIPLAEIEKLALSAKAAIPALEEFRNLTNVGVIAEIKRASPSKGLLAEISNPAKLATTYESFGAAAISVLTEERQFLGSLSDFDQVRKKVELPLLRKDFLASEYQILEARAHGADIVLLIVAGLKVNQLESLNRLAKELGMAVLVETHSKAELDIALSIEAELIGINARDLTTFETDRQLFTDLVDSMPKNVIKVAESAVRNVSDVRDYAVAGADMVLVGEALVTGDAETMLQEFCSVPRV